MLEPNLLKNRSANAFIYQPLKKSLLTFPKNSYTSCPVEVCHGLSNFRSPILNSFG